MERHIGQRNYTGIRCNWHEYDVRKYIEMDEKYKDIIKRAITIAIVAVLVVAATVITWIYYDSIIKTDPDENIQSLVDSLDNIEIASNIKGLDGIDITKSELLSDTDNDAYKDALVDTVSNGYSISSDGYTVDKETKSAEVKLKVTYVNFEGYSDTVIKQLSDKLPDIIKQNLSKTDNVADSGENSSESLRILTDPLKSLASNEADLKVTLYYDKKSYDWLPTSEDLEKLELEVKEFIGTGLFEQVNQIIDKSNALNIFDLLDEDEYKVLINAAMNKQLGTVKEIDYTEYIDAYMDEHPELFEKNSKSEDDGERADSSEEQARSEDLVESETNTD